MRQRIVTVRRLSAWLRSPEFWLVCLLIWLLLSACRSLGTPWARAGLTECLRWGIGISLALALSATLQRTVAAARFLLCVAGALSLAGIWDGLRTDGGGLVGPYQDHQLYGSALLVLLPNALALSLSGRDLRWRLGAQAVTAALLLCLLLSETRSAWAGALASCLIFGGLWARNSHAVRCRWRTAAFCAAALLAGAVSVWTATAPAEIRTPLALRTATLTDLGTDRSWQARLSTWQGAARMAASQPMVGFGLGRYPAMQWRWTHQGSPLLPSTRPSLSEEAHDLYLQTAAETGWIGLGLYGIALAAIVRHGLSRLSRKQRLHRHGNRDALVVAAISMIVGQSVDALGSPSWQFGEVSLLFWAALGVGLSAMRRHEAEPAAVHFPISLPLRRPGQMAFFGATVLFLAAQILPLGLLTPVEAYTSPSSYVIQSPPCNIVPYDPANIPTIHSGQTIDYTLIANYKDASGNVYNPDVTTDSTTVFTPTHGTVMLVGSLRRFTAPTVTNNTPITISAYFIDSRGGNTVHRNASPSAQVNVIP